MTDYSKGKIYQITSASHPDLIYIGSTTLKLKKRMDGHRAMRNGCSSIELLILGDAEIKLIHNFPCDSELELRMEEQRIMNTYPVIVNKQSAYLSDEERIAKDKERNKLYRESHKEEVAEMCKKWHEENREYALMKCREWNETHKKETAAKRSQRYLCGCGVESSYLHKSRHEKTAFHLQNISK